MKFNLRRYMDCDHDFNSKITIFSTKGIKTSDTCILCGMNKEILEHVNTLKQIDDRRKGRSTSIEK